MASVTNPFEITWGSRAVGGASSDYQIHGPYVFDFSFERLRLVFDVVVVATSFGTLQTLSDALQDDFRKRDLSLVIDLDGSTFTYTFGTDILNSKSSIAKSGDPDTDSGFSRRYTCVVEGDVPTDVDNGLQQLEVNVTHEAGRQKTVTMRGVYTSLSGVLAVAQYAAQFDAEASTILTAIDSSATFELVAENTSRDRNDHLVTFTRQFLELLVNQTGGALDATNIRDHRLRFTEQRSHPGDALESINRLRRVVGTYDCAIDIDQTTNLQAVLEDEIRPHLVALFQATFSPQVFGLEDFRASFDESTKRLSASFQFLYQSPEGSEIIEVSQSVAFRETRHIDYTPTHDEFELSADADPGWATLERVWTRVVTTLGQEFAKTRIAAGTALGSAGAWGPSFQPVQPDGWNIVANTSHIAEQWFGDPTGAQFQVWALSETIVERFTSPPGTSASLSGGSGSGGGAGGGSGPGTGGGTGGSGGSSAQFGPGRPLGSTGGTGVRTTRGPSGN